MMFRVRVIIFSLLIIQPLGFILFFMAFGFQRGINDCRKTFFSFKTPIFESILDTFLSETDLQLDFCSLNNSLNLLWRCYMWLFKLCSREGLLVMIYLAEREGLSLGVVGLIQPFSTLVPKNGLSIELLYLYRKDETTLLRLPRAGLD